MMCSALMMLTLVLVNALDLDVEHRIGIHARRRSRRWIYLGEIHACWRVLDGAPLALQNAASSTNGSSSAQFIEIADPGARRCGG